MLVSDCEYARNVYGIFVSLVHICVHDIAAFAANETNPMQRNMNIECNIVYPN